MITIRSFFLLTMLTTKLLTMSTTTNPRIKRPEYLAADERILSLEHSFVNNPNQDVILFLRSLAHNS